MDPADALFWNLVSGWKHSSGGWICIINLSHNNDDNNNNGGLHACVGAAEDIEPIRVTRTKYSAALPRRWAEKVLWTTDEPFSSSTCCVSPSTVCLSTALKLYALAPSLLLRFWWISSATYRLEYELQRVESFTMDLFGRKYSWNDAEEGKKEKKIVLVRVDMI